MNINNFDLNLLRALDALIRERNVTHAAEQLHVTQQAMSGALRRLRGHFDDELLVRVGRGMELTPLAQALIVPVREALLMVNTVLETEPKFDPGSARHRFRLGMSDYSSLIFLPRLLRRLNDEAPNIAVEVEGLLDKAYLALESGELDFCISPMDPDLFLNFRLSDNIVHDPLFQDDFVCVVDNRSFGCTGPLTHQQYIEAKHNVVRMGEGVETVVEHAWRLAEFRPKVAATAPSFSALIFALPGTPLVATAQRKLANAIAPILGLSIYPCPMSIPQLREDMIWHERNRDNLAHAYMRRVLVEEAASLSISHN